MADCHDLFTKFYNDEVKLEETTRVELRKSRNAIRSEIKKHFTEKLEVEKQPLFYGQGSYMMRTEVVMLPDHEYDIDDGLYLQHLKDNEWPTTKTVHNWVVEAVKDHTSTDPVDKNTCVRVIYARSYHVDIPIYAQEGEMYKLAHKTKGWIDSDPRSITDWFQDQIKTKDQQLRRIVQYFKVWKDYTESNTKFPSGLALTVLAANDFSSDIRDDIALLNCAKNIKTTLSLNFSAIKPVMPYDDLLENWSQTRKDGFLNKLQKLIDKGQEAIDSSDKVEASDKWIVIFGSRFPIYDPPEDKQKNSAWITSSPAILGKANDRSA